MSADDSFNEENTRERERLRSLVERLSDDDLRRPMYGDWTVAGVLGHMAFWDARVLVLGGKIARGEALLPDDDEPENVDWINDSARLLIDAIEPRAVAELALRLAEETDALVASLDPARMYPADESSPVNALRASHRAEHLDDIEAALR
jgi:hypothetical protein